MLYNSSGQMVDHGPFLSQLFIFTHDYFKFEDKQKIK